MAEETELCVCVCEWVRGRPPRTLKCQNGRQRGIDGWQATVVSRSVTIGLFHVCVWVCWGAYAPVCVRTRLLMRRERELESDEDRMIGARLPVFAACTYVCVCVCLVQRICFLSFFKLYLCIHCAAPDETTSNIYMYVGCQ